MQITLPITLTIAAAAALINIWLGTRVIRLRFSERVPMGHGGNAAVESRMRAQANFIEYTPLFLILLALVELSEGSRPWLWGVAILFILARLAHPFGMDRPAPNKLRVVGVIVTFTVLIGLACYALTIPYLDRARTPVSFAGF